MGSSVPVPDQTLQPSTAIPLGSSSNSVPATPDLENRLGPAQQQLGQALQDQQGQLSSAQDQLQSPIQQQIQRESQAIASQQPTSDRGGRVKRLLYSFLQGAGDALAHDAGLPSQRDIQQ